MLGTRWVEPALDPHHPDMIAIRVKPLAARAARRLSTHPDLAARESPGLHALRRHEREGFLHYVLPLGRSARRAVARSGRSGSVESAILAAAREHDPGSPHTAHVLIHLKDPRLGPALRRRLLTDPHVISVSLVACRYLLATDSPAGLLPPERMWNHARIQLAEARSLNAFRSPRRIRVAVLDSGVQLRHPALRGRIHDYVHSFEAGHPVHVSARDIVGHGTHIAGIINAARDSTLGVQGIAECNLTVIKVFDDHTTADPGAGARVFMVNPLLYRWALAECLSRRVDVLNLSLGGPAPPDPHEASVTQALLARGTVIVAAMGNALSRRNQPSYPAATPGVIAVGAVGPDDVVAPFSRRGPHIALAAPGVAIWSTLPTFPGEFGFLNPGSGKERRARPRPLARNTHYDAWPGTSGACPHVTAAVALLLASKGRLSPAQVKLRLMRTADRVPGMRGRRFDPSYGAGRLNLRRLLSG